MPFLISQRQRVLIGACAALAGVLADHQHLPRVIYNPSASAPRGWYRVAPAQGLKVDDYVLVNLPGRIKRLADQRHYLPVSVPLLKRIGAVAHQFVCARGRSLWIDGHLASIALTHDSAGRELVAWHGCRGLGADELLLISRDHIDSFDSRYFGPIRMGAVMGKVSPVWTW
jgi:conjugative transfer signal peptidase TraF